MTDDLTRRVIQASGPPAVDDLTTFLRKRLAEDVHTARRLATTRHGVAIIAVGDGEDPIVLGPEWMLQDIEAKRAIVDRYEQAVHARIRLQTNDPAINATRETWIRAMEYAVAQLALPYQDHPDYSQSWRP